MNGSDAIMRALAALVRRGAAQKATAQLSGSVKTRGELGPKLGQKCVTWRSFPPRRKRDLFVAVVALEGESSRDEIDITWKNIQDDVIKGLL